MKRLTRLRGFTNGLRCTLFVAFVATMASTCRADDVDVPPAPEPATTTPASAGAQQLPVNWLYGAYIPREAPLEALSGKDRWRLYLRQGFVTPGIYVKTGLFTISDQAREVPAGWPQDPEGFAKRVGTRYAQFQIQNGFTAVADATAGWEPRYDVCRDCTGIGQRIRHAIIRNFVTYSNDEQSLRPQIFLYAGSFGGAAVAALWQPYIPNPLVKGYQGVATQAWVGVACNMLAEFVPDLKRAMREKKEEKKEDKAGTPASQH